MSERGQLEISLGPDTTAALLGLAAQENLLPETVLTAAWALLLSRYTGDDTVTLSASALPLSIPSQMPTRRWLRNIPGAGGAIVCALSGPQATIQIHYDASLFGADPLPRLSHYISRLVDEIRLRLDDPVSSIEMLSADEKGQLLVEWNRTAADYPAHQCVHEQFEMQAMRTPDATALVFQDRSLTYRELDESANRLARRLVNWGVGPETLVGISLDRSLDMVVALLAILKAGGAYVPLDPAYPPQRLAMVLADAQPRIVVTQDRLAVHLLTAARVLSVDSEWEAIAGESPAPLGVRATSRNLAYVIYTSGSTGKPKGAMIEHRNLANFFTAMDHTIGGPVAGVWLAVTSIAFDISVLELFWTLTRGCKVVLQGDEPIARNIRAHGVTHLQCTPSLARMLLSDRDSVQALAALQMLLLGGEALPPSLAAQARLVVAGRIFNMYGPTETTIWSTTHLVEETSHAIPIGRPIANTQVYILDQWLRPVPTGAIGELYIAGAGVARGYLNRPGLTTERFLANPFSGEPAARMYRTGDLARYLPSGAIEYMGRADFQVKVGGNRIELGEIETVLERHRGVREAVVTAREDQPGDKWLVAYVALNPNDPPRSRELQSYLRDILPEYMVPAVFVRVPAMPLTANRKIDRYALPVRERETPLTPAYAPAETDLQERLVEIWKGALNLDQVGIHDDFFDLGGDSLTAAQVFTSIRKAYRLDLDLRLLFEARTVAAFAEVIHKELEQPRGQRAISRRRWTPLVPIHASGGMPPLYFVSGSGGHVLPFQTISSYLGPEQPVYALQPRGLYDTQSFLTRIEDIAGHYLREIKTVQRAGPYYLAGYSFGGVVAFEMAQQLRASGEEVGLLALLDSKLRWWERAPDSHTHTDRLNHYMSRLKYYFGEPNGPAKLFRTMRVKSLGTVRVGSRMALRRAFRSVGRTLPRPIGTVEDANWFAEANYKPQAYSGRLILVRCSETAAADRDDLLLGWRDLAADIDVKETPGNHFTFVKGSNIVHLAETLRSCMSEGTARTARTLGAVS
ncbi:MAG TPA: amino acid adenylation domain-containing protein [Bryobacteraceae bacterium]|nr:amino acid adenylation domain-containing protein [Bryobacteraceae bacterium]